MVLSRIALDITKRAVMIALQNPEMFHGAIEQAIEPRDSRTLWRIDVLRGQYYILLLSEKTLQLDAFIQQFGIINKAETRDYAPLLNRIVDGSAWQFRLCANPTYSRPNSSGRGMVCAHKTVEHQCQWLKKQASKHGFCVVDDDFTVVGEQWYSFSKPTGDRVKLLNVTFEGQLTVTDSQTFQKALIHGIGRAKAYGMGLLTVARR